MRKFMLSAVVSIVACLAVPGIASAGDYPSPNPQGAPNQNRACGFGQGFLRSHIGDLGIAGTVVSGHDSKARTSGYPSPEPTTTLSLRRVRLIGALSDDDNARVDCAFALTLRQRSVIRVKHHRPVVRVRRYGCLADVAVTRATGGGLAAELAFSRCARLRRSNALFPRIDRFEDGPFDDRSAEAPAAA